MKNKPLPPIDLVRDFLSYDQHTGIFVYKQKRGRAVVGKIAGSNHQHDESPHLWYQVIGINKQYYKAHRLAWYLFYGVDPAENEIDHKDGNGLNNAISNLRICTSGQNNQNRRLRTNNVTGLNGVDFMKRQGKYRARISKEGKTVFLGVFESAEQAFAAHEKARHNLFDFCTGRYKETCASKNMEGGAA